MNKSYKVRSGIVFLSFCSLYLIILLNLYRIQIINHRFFVELGEKQYNVTLTTFPPRAAIYDRTGKQLLAMNNDSLAAFVVPSKLKSPDEVRAYLKKHFPLAYERLNAHPTAHFMYVGRRLTDKEAALIEASNLPDIQILHEPHRYYPVQAAGQILGITDIDNKGVFGLEMHFDKQLSGTPSTYYLERDARSGHFYFKRRLAIEGTQGEPLLLTIDSDLQFLAQEELKKTVEQFQAKEGAVLIMDPQTGDILAMSSWPGFDPNNTKNIVMENTKNRIITEEYELGSVIKTFAALASIAEGVVTIDELIDCENVKTTYIDGRRINTVPSSVAGIIPFSEVIAKSNNIGIAKVTKRLGPKLYDHYIRLGFGKKTGVQFPGERSGFVNHPKAWSKQSIFSLSYGYEITATLLQLARAFCIIANGGYDVPPTLLVHERKPKSSAPLYSPETIATLQQILETTVLQGSAKKAHIEGYKVMSKTGTANILINGEYSPIHNIYTCAGIIEKNSYQRVIVTFIKEANQKNLYASTVATPLLGRLAEKTIIHDKIL